MSRRARWTGWGQESKWASGRVQTMAPSQSHHKLAVLSPGVLRAQGEGGWPPRLGTAGRTRGAEAHGGGGRVGKAREPRRRDKGRSRACEQQRCRRRHAERLGRHSLAFEVQVVVAAPDAHKKDASGGACTRELRTTHTPTYGQTSRPRINVGRGRRNCFVATSAGHNRRILCVVRAGNPPSTHTNMPGAPTCLQCDIHARKQRRGGPQARERAQPFLCTHRWRRPSRIPDLCVFVGS